MADGLSWARTRWERLPASEREVVGLALLIKISFALIALSAPMLFKGGTDFPRWTEAWQQWDVQHFVEIARNGYPDAQAQDITKAAFFPGLPSLMWLGHLVGVPYVVTGVIAANICSVIAAVYLARIMRFELSAATTLSASRIDRRGQLAALIWLAAPMAVFLNVPYTEPLFCACAFPAWLAARRGNWYTAGLLAALAASLRISGLFLAVAIVIEYLVGQRGLRAAGGFARIARTLPAFVMPLVPLAGFVTFLYRRTHNWSTWIDAQQSGWMRTWTNPAESLLHTWQAGFTRQFGPERGDWTWLFRTELVAVIIAVLLIGCLIRQRRWAESVFLMLNLAAFVSSYWVYSFSRSMLLWWPLWTISAGVLGRHVWARRAYFAVTLPLAVIWTAAYVIGKWAG